MVEKPRKNKELSYKPIVEVNGIVKKKICSNPNEGAKKANTSRKKS